MPDARETNSSHSLGGVPNKRPRSPKTAEIVARRIVDDVVHRGLAPGTALAPEMEMLRAYQVSRASLREALRILEVYGLITMKAGPNGGPQVSRVDGVDFGKTATFYFQVSGATFRELAEAREQLEPVMAEMAARRKSKDLVRELEALVEEMGRLDPGDTEAQVASSRRFHSLVARMSGNRVLSLVSDSFKEIFSLYTASPVGPEDVRRIARIHEKIGKAILQGDGPLAKKYMARHLEQSSKDFEERYPSLIDRAPNWL